MATDASGEDRFGLRLPARAARVLDLLRRRGLPAGARPTPRSLVIERAILALAEVEGIDVGEV